MKPNNYNNSTHFLYMAAHDIQEPIRTLQTSLDLLNQKCGDALNDECRLLLKQALNNSSNALALVHDILDYSKAKGTAYNFETIALGDVLDTVKSNLSVLITENQAKIINDKLPVVNADGMRIMRVFQNLISNAVKFCKDRQPEINIKSRITTSGVEICVKDNGIGMDEKNIRKIFNAFQRLNNKNEFPGTGLGLAICKQIIERHNGKIWVDSTPGVGSSFYFTINTGNSEER